MRRYFATFLVAAALGLVGSGVQAGADAVGIGFRLQIYSHPPRFELVSESTDEMTDTAVTSQTIAVEHIRISSQRPFEDVRRKFEETVPKLDPDITEVLRSGDQRGAQEYEETGPKVSIFLQRDHGALLQIAGGKRNALQYEIGNPLTASKMTRHQLPAALYAPLRVVLFEDDKGKGIFEYDKPSSFFGQYGDERVTEVGEYLDDALQAVLLNAAR